MSTPSGDLWKADTKSTNDFITTLFGADVTDPEETSRIRLLPRRSLRIADDVDRSCSPRCRNAPYCSCYWLLIKGATQCRLAACILPYLALIERNSRQMRPKLSISENPLFAIQEILEKEVLNVVATIEKTLNGHPELWTTGSMRTYRNENSFDDVNPAQQHITQWLFFIEVTKGKVMIFLQRFDENLPPYFDEDDLLEHKEF